MSTRENKIRYKIIFDHAQYEIVKKPTGMLSVTERFTDKVSLRKLLNDRYGRLYAVHLLDQFTSGIILFAKNKESHRTWNQLFENEKVTKKYLAITSGVFQEESGIIVLPILSLYGLHKVVIITLGQQSQTVLRVY